MKIKLAEALLKRKELQERVDRLRSLQHADFAELKIKRVNVTESTDEVRASVPYFSMQQLTHAFDTAAKNLRLVDAAIQQANWTTEIEVDDVVVADYVDPYVKDDKAA